MGKSKYHEEVMINVGTEEEPRMVPRRKCSRIPVDVEAKDGTPLVAFSDRVYIKAKDGSIRSTKTKVSKKERMRMREEQNAG